MDELLHAFETMATSYLDEVRFEQRTDLEARTASLLPALTLARIDGKSPVEYLAGRPVEQDLVRRLTGPLIVRPVDSLETIVAAWRAGAGSEFAAGA